MHTPLWRGSILINVVRGSKVSQARPLGQVHKDGHAILCVLTFASTFNNVKPNKLMYHNQNLKIMKKLLSQFGTFAFLISTLFVCTACPDDDPEPELSVSKTSISLLANGDGDKDITVTASHTDWNVSVTEGSSWLRVNKNGQLATVSAEANSMAQTRTGKIKIIATENASLSYDISVSQAGADGTITVSVGSVEFDPEGGSQTIQVTSNSGWNVSGNQSWLTVSPSSSSAQTSGSGATNATLVANENKTNSDRTCTVTFTTTDGKSSATVAVRQKNPIPVIQINGVKDAELAPFPGLFDGKSGIDYKEAITVTSNVSWSLSGVPDWVNVSPSNGNGTVQMTIYPKNENPSASTRTATITISGEGVTATLKVQQLGGVPDVKVTPDNLIALYNQIGWELKKTGNVDKYQMICVTEAVFNRKTDKELLEDLRTDEAEKFSNEPVFFYAKDSYGNSISQNTTYYICTVAYDENDTAGELVKTKITTPKYIDYNNDAFVSFSDVSCSSSMFQFTITKEGFCNTYHVVYGNVPSTFANYNKVLYAFEINYYLKNKKKHWLATEYNLEIVTDYPNSHTFTHYTSTLSTRPVAIAYGWGVFSDGRLSSDMIGFSWDTSSDDARQIMMSRSTDVPSGNLILKRPNKQTYSRGLRK